MAKRHFSQGGDAKAIKKVADEHFEGDYAAMFRDHGWPERGQKMMPMAQKRAAETYGSVRAFEAHFELRTWLETRKPEEVALFAARAALRTLPVLGIDKRKEEMPATLLLPALSAMAASWFAGTWPDVIRQTSYSSARTTFFRSRDNLRSVIGSMYVGNLVIVAARDAIFAAGGIAEVAVDTTDVNEKFNADLTHAMIASQTAEIAKAPYDLAKIIASVAPDHIISALKNATNAASAADKAALEKGTSVAELSAMPLWSDGDTPDAMGGIWEKLKSRLPEGEDWDVWTTWYEARLRGTRADKELEKARVLIPKEDWEQGPAHVNAIIKRLIAEHDGLDFEKFQEIVANAETPRLGSPEELKARRGDGNRFTGRQPTAWGHGTQPAPRGTSTSRRRPRYSQRKRRCHQGGNSGGDARHRACCAKRIRPEAGRWVGGRESEHDGKRVLQGVWCYSGTRGCCWDIRCNFSAALLGETGDFA